jgi:hypothetical protein
MRYASKSVATSASAITVKAHRGQVMPKMKTDPLAEAGENGRETPRRISAERLTVRFIDLLLLLTPR